MGFNSAIKELNMILTHHNHSLFEIIFCNSSHNSESQQLYKHRQIMWFSKLIQLFFSYWFTPWSRVLLEKLTGFQIVKKFPAFYGIQKFTSARHLSLSWASSIQSIPPHPTSWRTILILSSHLRPGLHSGLFPSDFRTKTQYTPLLFPIRATCTAHLLFLYCDVCIYFLFTFPAGCRVAQRRHDSVY